MEGGVYVLMTGPNSSVDICLANIIFLFLDSDFPIVNLTSHVVFPGRLEREVEMVWRCKPL